ncbi:hypothetical protein C8R46DRAFT_1227239 [Mycena filopes]|nr:hypothetical protein C8R46DRAFT_1227239 [Mycena filopes]
MASHQSALSSLPSEIIDEIAQHGRCRDVAALSRAGNHRIRANCLPRIYSNVHVDNGNLLLFCDTLSANEGYPRMVKRFHIDCDDGVFSSPQSPTDERLSSLLNHTRDRTAAYLAVIAGFSRLIELAMYKPARFMLTLPFAWKVFPLLRVVFAPCYSLALSIFLFRHPKLEFLSIDPNTAMDPAEDNRILRMHLPSLRAFDGPAAMVRVVVPASPVSRLTIFWKEVRGHWCIRNLTQAQTTITHLNIVLDGWHTLRLNVLVKHLPDLTYLNFQNRRRTTEHSTPEPLTLEAYLRIVGSMLRTMAFTLYI